MTPASCRYCGEAIWSRRRTVCPRCRAAKVKPRHLEDPPGASVLEAALQDLRAGPKRATSKTRRCRKTGERYYGGEAQVRPKRSDW